MNYMDSVTRAVTYIEEHLHEELTAEDIAREAGYSPYHFHRIFQSVTRNSMAQYIRKRRLTHAAYELFHTRHRMIDIAVKYRFESQEAFTRAFQSMFSLTPGQFRRQTDMKQTPFRAMERTALDDSALRHLVHGITHEPLIVTLESLQLVGMEIHSFDPGDIGGLWKDFRQRTSEIAGRSSPESVYYALVELTNVQWEASYCACVEVSGPAGRPSGMVYKLLPPSTYAIFSHKGPLAKIPDTFHYIYSTWLPKSGRQRSHAPEFARYDQRYLGPANEASELDIYIPVEPSSEHR